MSEHPSSTPRTNRRQAHVKSDYRYGRIPEDLLYDTDLSPHASRVYAALDRHGQTPESCYPSHARVAKLLGLSVSTVRRAVEELETAGWVTRYPRFNDKGEQSSNGYRLHTSAINVLQERVTTQQLFDAGLLGPIEVEEPVEQGDDPQSSTGWSPVTVPGGHQWTGGVFMGEHLTKAIEREPLNETPLPPTSPPSVRPDGEATKKGEAELSKLRNEARERIARTLVLALTDSDGLRSIHKRKMAEARRFADDLLGDGLVPSDEEIRRRVSNARSVMPRLSTVEGMAEHWDRALEYQPDSNAEDDAFAAVARVMGAEDSRILDSGEHVD